MASGPTAAQVRAARHAAALTQSKAGTLIGASLRTWQEWEGGRRNMPSAKFALFLLLTQPQRPQPAPLRADEPSPE